MRKWQIIEEVESGNHMIVELYNSDGNHEEIDTQYSACIGNLQNAINAIDTASKIIDAYHI